jgi:ribose transport system substrate-binding protein
MTATPRRDFLSLAAAGTLSTALLAGCRSSAAESSGTRLKACFSNANLKATWCAAGKQAAELWGELLGVDVTWIDGENNPEKQRSKIDLITGEDWDFCCFQAVQTDILAEPVRKLAERGIPVISMDTLLVPEDKLRETGVWMVVAPDQDELGAASGRYLIDKLNGTGRVIHIGGRSSHSGAQARARGFESVVNSLPDIQIVGGAVRWCDWSEEKARATFEAILSQEEEPIQAAFFHNDDMALACVPALAGTPHEGMLICGVDGQRQGLEGVRDGKLNSTVVNPAALIHKTALEIGRFFVARGEKVDDVPLHVQLPGPLVSQESGNLDAMFYLSDPARSLL